MNDSPSETTPKATTEASPKATENSAPKETKEANVPSREEIKEEELKESAVTADTNASAVRKSSTEDKRKNSAEDKRKGSGEEPQEAAPGGRDYDGAIVERKKESFQNFQNVEQQRRAIVESHRAILINMVSNIDMKLQWLDAGVEKIVKFFKDRASQEEEYTKLMTNGLPKLAPSFKDNANPDMFINLTKAMVECDEFHVRQSQNSDLLAKYLKKNILDNIIYASEKDFRKQLEALISPLEDMKKRLTNIQQDRLKKLKSYVFSFNEATRGGKITKDRDMFKNEIENLSLGFEELRVMKSYATQALLLVNETVKLLIKRFTEIQKAFDLYFQKYSELYGSRAANADMAIQMMQRFNSFDEVQHVFSSRSILKPEDLLYIKQKSGRQEVTYQEVFDVLVNIPNPPDITRSPLVIKEWKAQKDAGLLKGLKPCNVVITIDGNILVLEKSPEGEIVEADNILRLQNLKIMPKEEKKDGSIVDIVEVIPGLIIDSKQKVSLKFDSVDGAEEFRHYLYNYYTTTVLDARK